MMAQLILVSERDPWSWDFKNGMSSPYIVFKIVHSWELIILFTYLGDISKKYNITG